MVALLSPVRLSPARLEVAFPELDPNVADAVDEMLVRLGSYAQRWGSADAAILARKLVGATLDGNAVTRGWLRQAERFLASR